MIDVSLKRGATQTVSFTLHDSGGAPLNLTSLSVSLVVDGGGAHVVVAGTKDAPDTLGTGVFAFTGAELPITLQRDGRRKSDPHVAEIWVHGTGVNIACGTFRIDVTDVPQRV